MKNQNISFGKKVFIAVSILTLISAISITIDNSALAQGKSEQAKTKSPREKPSKSEKIDKSGKIKNQNLINNKNENNNSALLKGLNSYNANPKAFENANPRSQIGLIMTYLEVRKKSNAFQIEIEDSKQELISLQSQLISMNEQISNLNPEDENYIELFSELETNKAKIELQINEEEQNLLVLETAYQDNLNLEDDTWVSMTKGQELSEEEAKEIELIISSSL